MSDAATVTAEMDLRRVVTEHRDAYVLVRFGYTTADPWAVRLNFRAAGGDGIEWVFARELLADGLTKPAGEGDVQAWPGADDSVTHLLLRSPAGSATFEIDRSELQAFLNQSYLLVPVGAEIELVNLDGELALLLGSDH